MKKGYRYGTAARTAITAFLCLAFSTLQGNGAGIVPPGTSRLADNGTASNPARWWFNGDYTSPTGAVFEIGVRVSGNANYNYLTVSNGQTFIASAGLWVGRNNTYHNLLDVREGALVEVHGDAHCGEGSIMYYSKYNRINVSGASARFLVTDNLILSSGFNGTDNYLSLSDGGIAVVDSDKDGTGSFYLYNHWAYGNCWLELNGGALLLYGDKTADFASGKGILSSIKVWDPVSNSLERVAYYDNQVLKETPSKQFLEVAYLQTAADAADRGLGSEYAGYTIVRNIPEPGTLGLMLPAAGGILWWRLRKERRRGFRRRR